MELLLFTSYYPYEFGDTFFIKPEIPFLSRVFDKIHIINIDREGVKHKKVDVPSNLYTVPTEIFMSKFRSKYKKAHSLFSFFFHPFRLTYILFFELCILLKHKNLNFSTFKTAISYLLNANLLALTIKQYLLHNPKIKLIYTYWFKCETLASLICKQFYNSPVKCITRTHGGDLFEFVQKNNYQPYKKWMDNYIDRIFFASKAGYDYYLNLFAGKHKFKYIISRLGNINPYKFQENNYLNYSNTNLNIVSCSYMIPIKRIHLIINAISEINDIIINWVHIGNGVESDNLNNLANNLLYNKTNISYNFIGFLTNDSIKKYYYENYFDCFISTTASEGGNPVSMMEAISFGIPVIASNVGGVPEIVNEETGMLLNPDNCVKELAKALHQFSAMTVLEKETLRKSCRIFWEENYNADTQYPLFIDNINNLLLE